MLYFLPNIFTKLYRGSEWSWCTDVPWRQTVVVNRHIWWAVYKDGEHPATEWLRQPDALADAEQSETDVARHQVSWPAQWGLRRPAIDDGCLCELSCLHLTILNCCTVTCLLCWILFDTCTVCIVLDIPARCHIYWLLSYIELFSQAVVVLSCILCMQQFHIAECTVDSILNSCVNCAANSNNNNNSISNNNSKCVSKTHIWQMRGAVNTICATPSHSFQGQHQDNSGQRQSAADPQTKPTD